MISISIYVIVEMMKFALLAYLKYKAINNKIDKIGFPAGFEIVVNKYFYMHLQNFILFFSIPSFTLGKQPKLSQHDNRIKSNPLRKENTSLFPTLVPRSVI